MGMETHTQSERARHEASLNGANLSRPIRVRWRSKPVVVYRAPGSCGDGEHHPTHSSWELPTYSHRRRFLAGSVYNHRPCWDPARFFVPAILRGCSLGRIYAEQLSVRPPCDSISTPVFITTPHEHLPPKSLGLHRIATATCVSCISTEKVERLKMPSRRPLGICGVGTFHFVACFASCHGGS